MCRMADRSQQRRAAAWHSPRCHRGQQPFTPNALSTPLRVSALSQMMRALFRHAYGLERPFSKGIPVETKWNSSGQIPLPQGLMAEPDPLGGNHTTPGGGCLPPPTNATSTSPARTLQALPETKAQEHMGRTTHTAVCPGVGPRSPPIPGDAWGQLDRKQRRGKSKRSSSELFNTSLYCLCF